MTPLNFGLWSAFPFFEFFRQSNFLGNYHHQLYQTTTTLVHMTENTAASFIKKWHKL